MGAWRADYREQRAFAVHPIEGADYLVVVFGVLMLNNTWGPEVICRGCLLCRMQERLAVFHDCFQVVPTLIEAPGYALFQEGFGVVLRPVCVWSTSALSKTVKSGGASRAAFVVWNWPLRNSSFCHPRFLESAGNTHPLQRCA